MISASNTAEIARQLEEFSKEVQRKLEFMVEQFAVDVVQAGVKNTPLGDAEKYIGFYQSRLTDGSGLPDEEGVARGAWVVGLDGQLSFVPISGQNTDAEAIAEAKMDIQGYRLGQNFVIGNAAPYIGDLENNYSDQTNGQGIMKPTLAEIQAAHESDLKRYYDAG